MANQKNTKLKIDQQCPVCSKGKLFLRTQRSTKQKFLGCSTYPKCKATFTGVKPPVVLNKTTQDKSDPSNWNRKCPKCKIGVMVKRNGPYNSFGGCSTYPKCTHTSQNKTTEYYDKKKKRKPKKGRRRASLTLSQQRMRSGAYRPYQK